MLGSDANKALRQVLAGDAAGKWSRTVSHLAAGRHGEARSVLHSMDGDQHPWLKDYLDAVVSDWLEDYESAEEATDRPSLKDSPLQFVQMLRAEIYHTLALRYLQRLLREHPEILPFGFRPGRESRGAGKARGRGRIQGRDCEMSRQHPDSNCID